MTGLITRRLALAGMLTSIAAAARAAPSSLPDAPKIMVAGPAGGWVDQWARLIAAPLAISLQADGAVTRENVGGADGVTGANQFEARTPPDGGTALLAPGTAMLSWLVGDPRVRFDAGRWVPLWGGNVTTIVASRAPLRPGRPVRMAVRSVAAPELMALLALELMGVSVEPVRLDPADPKLLARPDIGAVLLSGRNLRARAAGLAAGGWRPAFGLGVIGQDGTLQRDPFYPDLPIAQELIPPTRRIAWPGLAAALPAVVAAGTLDIAFVLPNVAPAAVVAWWRRGCDGLAGVPLVQAEAARSLVQPVGAGRMAANLASITVDPPVLLDLRRWLADRYQWQPT